MMKLTVVCLFVTICVIAAQECQQGETKTKECNTCRCAGGNWACTRKYCVRGKREALEANHEVAREKREVPGADVLAITPCAPNDYFQLDCNVCYCKTDRTGYLCTDNNCSDEAWALSTTTHIPLSKDSMLIMSNYGIELIENLQSKYPYRGRVSKSVESQTLSHETVDPEIVDLKTAEPESVDTKIVDHTTVESENVESETAKSETVETQTVIDENVETETVKDGHVETETLNDEPVETTTVNDESITHESTTSESTTPESTTPESTTPEPEPEPKPTGAGAKKSPRNPLILAHEQRRLANLRNQ